MSSQLPIVQIRRGTKTQWETVGIDIVPLDGEVVLEQSETTPRLKVGDGQRTYGELPYVTSNAEATEALWQTLVGRPQLTKGEGEGAVVGNDLATNKATGEYSTVFGIGNTAVSQAAHAEGTDTHAGLKAFGVESVDRQANTIKLYDVPNLDMELQKLAIDDVYSVRFRTQAYDYGKITAIDLDQKTITVDKLYTDELRTDTNNSIFFFAKPAVGTIDIGGYSHAEGYSSKALYQSHAEGCATTAYGRFSHTEGNGTSAGYCSHAEGQGTQASGEYAHAEGVDSAARGKYSHSEGTATNALGTASHVQGGSAAVYTGELDSESVKTAWDTSKNFTATVGSYSHAEGNNTLALGYAAHAEGITNMAQGQCAHAEGQNTVASGVNSHSEGYNTTASSEASHAEGNAAQAKGLACHAEGHMTIAEAAYSHAEGGETKATGNRSHAEGYKTVASFEATHAEGGGTTASGGYAHAEGHGTVASGGQGAHAEGSASKATGDSSHAEGYGGTAGGPHSHVQGTGCQTTAARAHAEGWSTLASGDSAHAEGKKTQATNINAHAEGESGVASGAASHAEGYGSAASGPYSHSENQSTKAIGARSHAQGWGTEAHGDASHAEGYYTKTAGANQHVQGRFNMPDATMAHIVGGGSSDTDRKNIHTVDWSGNAYFAGNLTIGGSIVTAGGGGTNTLNKANGTLDAETEIWAYQRVLQPGAGISGGYTNQWVYKTNLGSLVNKATQAHELAHDLQSWLSGGLYSVQKMHHRQLSPRTPSKAMSYATLNTLGGRVKRGSKTSEKCLKSTYTGHFQGEGTPMLQASFDPDTQETVFYVEQKLYEGHQEDVRVIFYDADCNGVFPVRFRTYREDSGSYIRDVNGEYLFDKISETYIPINTTYVKLGNGSKQKAYAGTQSESGDTHYRFQLQAAEDLYLASSYPIPAGRELTIYYKTGTNIPVALAKINSTDGHFCCSNIYEIMQSSSGFWVRSEINYDEGMGDDPDATPIRYSMFDGNTNICVTQAEINSGVNGAPYSYEFGVLTTGWANVNLSFPLDPGFNLSDNYNDTYELQLTGNYSNGGALFIDNQWICPLERNQTATVSKKSSATEDLDHLNFMLFSTGLIDKIYPAQFTATVKCVYTGTTPDYSPVKVASISVGNTRTIQINLISPQYDNSITGISYGDGRFTINGKLIAGEYIIPVEAFNLARETYTFEVKGISGSNTITQGTAWMMLGDSISGGCAVSQSVPASNYICSGELNVQNQGIFNAEVAYLRLVLHQDVMFNNFVFSVALAYPGSEFVEIRRYDIPEAVQQIDGYGLGGIRSASGTELYNYINFESLTFVRKCRLEGNTVYQLTEPESVDLSAYFTDNILDISDATQLRFISESNEAAHCEITYQIKNY